LNTGARPRHLLLGQALGDLKLPSRIVMAPMTRARAWNSDGAANELIAKYYAQRADAGLIITESCQISEVGRGYGGTPGVHTDAQAAGWRIVTDAVHRAGGRIFCQLWHAGRVSHTSLQPGGGDPVAPSAVRARDTSVFAVDRVGRVVYLPTSAPRALSREEVYGIINEFRASARLALMAGFDGVEVHAANGFLIDQFLRSTTNLRRDEFGGSAPKRVRLLEGVVDAVAEEVGADRVGVRLSPFVTLKDVEDPEIVETTLLAAESLHRSGAVYAHLAEAEWDTAPPVELEFRRAFRKRFPGTIVVAGGFGVTSAEQMLESGFADLIAFGRYFIGNPDLPRRMRDGSKLQWFDKTKLYGGGAEGYTDYGPQT
jgi:N-ethylmaleimide reductase